MNRDDDFDDDDVDQDDDEDALGSDDANDDVDFAREGMGIMSEMISGLQSWSGVGTDDLGAV